MQITAETLRHRRHLLRSIAELTLSSCPALPASSSKGSTPFPLLALPPELLLHVASHLPYPDLLALRLAHPTLYRTPLLATDRAVTLKVSWLVARRARHLLCPPTARTPRRLGLRSDREFVAHDEVREMLRRHRRHEECGEGRGECEVVGGATCGGREARGRIAKRTGAKGSGEGRKGRRRRWHWWAMASVMLYWVVLFTFTG